MRALSDDWQIAEVRALALRLRVGRRSGSGVGRGECNVQSPGPSRRVSMRTRRTPSTIHSATLMNTNHRILNHYRISLMFVITL